MNPTPKKSRAIDPAQYIYSQMIGAANTGRHEKECLNADYKPSH